MSDTCQTCGGSGAEQMDYLPQLRHAATTSSCPACHGTGKQVATPTDDTDDALVRYIGADDMQVNWGSCADPRPLLIVGNIYIVERIEEHSWHRKMFLRGIDCGRGFNSVSFEAVSGADARDYIARLAAAEHPITDDAVREALTELTAYFHPPAYDSLPYRSESWPAIIATLTSALADRERLAEMLAAAIENHLAEVVEHRATKAENERLRENDTPRKCPMCGEVMMSMPAAEAWQEAYRNGKAAALNDPAFVRVPRSVLGARSAYKHDESPDERGVRGYCTYLLREYEGAE